MNKFFITERGDIAHQIKTATENIRALYHPGDALLVVTKKLDSLLVQELCIAYKKCTIVHNNVTGFGGTYIEQGVSAPEEAMIAFDSLVEMGFPEKQLVLRIDPIIPTERGTEVALRVLNMCPPYVKRVRISFIDNYYSMKGMGLPWDTFHSPRECQEYALQRIYECIGDRTLEACGEPQLSINTGCISVKDYDILNLPRPDSIRRKGQRDSCLCLSTKTELLVKPTSCPNGCVYCYYGLGKKL